MYVYICIHICARPAWLLDCAPVSGNWARLVCLLRLMRNRLYAVSGRGATHPGGVSCLSVDPYIYIYIYIYIYMYI